MKLRLVAVSLILLLTLPCWSDEKQNDVMALVERERQFAKQCQEVGIRASFLQYLSDDAITFGPELRRGKAHLESRPPEGSYRPTLVWEPVYADMSAAGDLGYTTGPWTLTTKNGTTNGVFLSVWRRDSAHQWRVILDGGIETPSEQKAEAIAAAPQQRARKHPALTTSSARAALGVAEAEIAALAQKAGAGPAIAHRAAGTLRLNRNGRFPIVAVDEVRSYLKEQTTQYLFETTDTVISDSNDLALTVGTYRALTSPESDHGSYVRLWRMGETGSWVLTVDSLHPANKSR